MCGRYASTASSKEIEATFSITRITPQVRPRWNLAPTQDAPVVLYEGERKMELLRWGLIPSWAKTASIGAKTINARAETLVEKSAFKEAFRRRRCLVPTTGFYEWKRSGTTKTPMFIREADGHVFAFAGLWEEWLNAEGVPVRTFTIITTPPNALLKPIHDRMPAIIQRKHYETWLKPDGNVREIQALLAPHAEGDLVAVPVSSKVNSVALDEPGLVVPVEVPEQHQLL